MDDHVATLIPSNDPKVAISIDSPNVPRVQPSHIINGLLCLLLIVQVAHEHMTTICTDLCTTADVQTNKILTHNNYYLCPQAHSQLFNVAR